MILGRLRFIGKIGTPSFLGRRGITVVVSAYFDLLLRGITISFFTVLNLLKDNHCCILRCALLMNFERSIRLIEHYPAPRLNVRVFSYRKETPTSKLKGADKALTSLYLQCLGI